MAVPPPPVTAFLESLRAVFEFVSQYAYVLTVLAALVLFLPAPAIEAMGLTTWRDDHRGFWWIIGIVGALMTGERIVAALAKRVSAMREAKKAAREEKKIQDELTETIRQRLRTLSPAAKKLVSIQVAKNQQTIVAYAGFAPVDDLCTRQLLFPGQGTILEQTFIFPDDVWSMIQEMKSDFAPTEVQLKQYETELSGMVRRY